MEKERKIKVLSIVALIVAVLGLTVAFAALSQTLTINGKSKVEKNNADGTGDKWNIRFYGVSSDGTTIDESATIVKPVITGGSSYPAEAKDATLGATSILIGNKNEDGVVLKKPNDKVVYTFYVKNNGSINAEIDDVVKNLVCETSNENDKNFCDDVSLTLKYDDNNEDVKKGDKLGRGVSRKINLTFEFSNAATSLPTDDIIFFNGPILLTYVQSNS